MSEGRNPVFHCYASGWPKPSFSWFKGETEIQDGDAQHSYVLTERAQGLDLDILYVRAEHAGRYICVARNKFGEEQHDINLFLESKNPALLLICHSAPSLVLWLAHYPQHSQRLVLLFVSLSFFLNLLF